MTTSGIYSWPLTALEVIQSAAEELGAVAGGEELSGEDMNAALQRLNAMLNYWAGDGLQFHAEQTSVAFAASEGEIALSEDIRVINNAWLVTPSYNRILASWNRSQYLSLPRPGQEGSPSIWYAERAPSGLILHLWPVPSTAVTIALDYGRRVQTVTSTTETLDVPEEWQEAVVFGLAGRMANMFGSTKNDPNTVMRIDQRAESAYRRLLDRDRPDHYSLEPDY